jgi:hypothetical protein
MPELMAQRLNESALEKQKVDAFQTPERKWNPSHEVRLVNGFKSKIEEEKQQDKKYPESLLTKNEYSATRKFVQKHNWSEVQEEQLLDEIVHGYSQENNKMKN